MSDSSEHPQVQILDHGYVKLIESWGSDERVIEAARMSTAKGFLGWGPKGKECHHTGCGWKTDDPTFVGKCPQCGDYGLYTTQGDEKLLKFLWENAHQTPFEMAGFTIEVKAPIFVFREWHRHRVPFGYNEMSARYTPLPNENYVPTVDRLMVNSKTNKQAGTVKGADELTEAMAKNFRLALAKVYEDAENVYQTALKVGVPKELARVVLPVGRYSVMRATSNLRGWLGFLKLRCAPNAQSEIRRYAYTVAAIVKEKFPRTYEVSRESTGMP